MIISGAPPVARWHVLASHVWLHGCAPARSAPCCASTPRSSLAMGVVAPQVDRPEVAVGGGENPRVTALSPLRDRLYRRMGLRLARPALRRREPPVDIDGRGMAVWQPSVIGIGGHLAAPPLPHHRAYGSVPRRFGGSCFDEVGHGGQAPGAEASLAQCLMQGIGGAQAPRPFGALGHYECGRSGYPEATKCPDTSPRRLPSHPGEAAQSPPHPAVERRHLAQLADPEIPRPSAQERIQVRDHPRHADTTRAPGQFPHTALEPGDRLRGYAAPHLPSVPHSEAKEGTVPRAADGTLCGVHLKRASGSSPGAPVAVGSDPPAGFSRSPASAP
jgi:hypothetical protein